MKRIGLVLSLVIIVFTACVSTTTDTKEAENTSEEESITKLIQDGKVEAAKSYFLSRTNVNAADANGDTPLHAAAMIDDGDLCQFLILKGANIESRNKAGDTPLLVAIKNNKQKSSKTLVDMGANIWACDTSKKSAIALGQARGDPYYDILITRTSSMARDTGGATVVHYFVNTKDIKGISTCIARAIPLSQEDNEGATPLARAYTTLGDPTTATIAAALIEAGAAPLRGEYAYLEDCVRTRNPSMRLDDGQTPLHIATIQGVPGVVKYLLDRGAKPSLQDTSGATPLHEAVRYGQLECARLLLEHGADVNAKDSLSKTPILLIMQKDTATAMYDLLIDSGADCSAKDMFGDTVLHVASMSAVDKVVLEKLMAHGAAINARNKEGGTPLSIAIEQGLKSHIGFYASNGADIHAEDMNACTPLTTALESQDLSLLKLLLNNSNINTKDSSGNTPLHIALLEGARPDCVDYMLSLDSDVDARNKDGNSALYLAVELNRRDIGELLLNKGADIFATGNRNYSPLRLALTMGGERQSWLINSGTIAAQDGNGNTPLHYAADWNLEDAAISLCQKGALVNARNASGETPLFFAVKGGSRAIVGALTEWGADTNLKDYLGNSPLLVAVKWDKGAILDDLITLGANVDGRNFQGKTPLAEAVRTGRDNIAMKLLAAGANINATDDMGRSILMDSVSHNMISTTRFLLDNGASVQGQDIYGRSAFHEAVESGNIQMVSLLRANGGSPLMKDTYGRTPYSIAVHSGGQELLAATLGGDSTIVDSDGNSPVHICVIQGFGEEVLAYLISRGYPLSTRNAKGKTPLNIALEEDKDALSSVLLARGADPFISDDLDTNAIEIAVGKNKGDILKEMVQMGPDRTDIQGNGFLHIAAKCASKEQISSLLALGLNKDASNVSGERPVDVALRWKRTDAASVLQ